MFVSVFWSLFFILFMLFCLTRKNLHLFELIFIWFIVWLVQHSISLIISVNLGYLVISDKPIDYCLHIFLRLVVYPVTIVWTIDLKSKCNKGISKLLILVISILLLSSIEYLSIFKGIMINKNWGVWYSLSEWAITMLLSYCSWIWYRKILWRKDRFPC